MKNKIMRILFTNTCHICGQTIGVNENNICEECREEVVYIGMNKCTRCGRWLKDEEGVFCIQCREAKSYFDQGVNLFVHSGRVSKSVYQFKYDNRREYSGFYVREIMRVYGCLIKQWNVDVIIPIPIHRKRKQKRGYNQAEILAEELSKVSGIPVEKKVLIRSIDTVPQKELNEGMRMQNLQSAFMVDREKTKKIHRVLLVDDILTTGTTLNVCSRLLKTAGVGKVFFVCISAGYNGDNQS